MNNFLFLNNEKKNNLDIFIYNILIFIISFSLTCPGDPKLITLKGIKFIEGLRSFYPP